MLEKFLRRDRPAERGHGRGFRDIDAVGRRPDPRGAGETANGSRFASTCSQRRTVFRYFGGRYAFVCEPRSGRLRRHSSAARSRDPRERIPGSRRLLTESPNRRLGPWALRWQCGRKLRSPARAAASSPGGPAVPRREGEPVSDAEPNDTVPPEVQPTPRKGSSATVHLTRIYTRTGDDGRTGLADFERIPKDDARIVAFADCDETNSVLGVVRAIGRPSADTDRVLLRLQHELFDAGADLATP